jgi:hypothetical protein
MERLTLVMIARDTGPEVVDHADYPAYAYIPDAAEKLMQSTLELWWEGWGEAPVQYQVWSGSAEEPYKQLLYTMREQQRGREHCSGEVVVLCCQTGSLECYWVQYTLDDSGHYASTSVQAL